MVEKSVLDRIRESLATTGAGLQEEVKRQYSHECGHIGMAGITGLITSDGTAMADQILRGTTASNGWTVMDGTAKCEAIKRAFYLAWRGAFGLNGEPDPRPFGEGCCGFARAMGELIPGFPAADSINCGEEFNSKGMADELNKAARLAANNREAVLDQPYHLFFFSAVDGDRRTRFFDIMKGHEFSFAETATSAPRLGPCVETAYRDANGARHHVHRNYGQIRTETAREAMEQIAKESILTQVTQLAETLTHREALPVWKVIFEKLGCESAAFSLESVTDYRIETDQEISNAGQNRDNPTGKRSEVGGVHADAPAKTNGSAAKIPLKTCPQCQREVLTLITDHTTDKRYCYHCVPNPEACPGAVFISRKMDQLHAAGKLETYSVEQRLKDLNDPPRCECGAVLDVLDGELCSKCEREAVRLAHRIRQRQAGKPVNTSGAVENGSGMSPQNLTRLRLFDEPSAIASSNAFQVGRILIVHHEQLMGELICKLLEQNGYETRMESSSADAIRVAGQFAPGLLIIDPVMPQISGLDAAKHISGQTGCKVLLVSAGASDSGFEEILRDLRGEDCDCAALGLPFEREELLEQVRARIGSGTVVPDMDDRARTSEDVGPKAHSPGTMIDFANMKPVSSDTELPDGFARVIMPDGKCFDILEELCTKAREIEPGCVIMSRRATSQQVDDPRSNTAEDHNAGEITVVRPARDPLPLAHHQSAALERPADKLDAAVASRLLNGDLFRLECGREVVLEQCHIELSALGWLEGHKDFIRAEVIEALPKRIRGQFPGDYYGLLIKPIPEGDLPVYVFMVSLHCHQTVGFDPDKDCSSLVVCWFGNDIETNLSALIAREIRSVDWDKYAVNFAI